jgi:hypothetical protein
MLSKAACHLSLIMAPLSLHNAIQWGSSSQPLSLVYILKIERLQGNPVAGAGRPSSLLVRATLSTKPSSCNMNTLNLINCERLSHFALPHLQRRKAQEGDFRCQDISWGSALPHGLATYLRVELHTPSSLCCSQNLPKAWTRPDLCQKRRWKRHGL